MATTTMGEQPFSRIVETRKTTSWIIAVPVALLVVLAIALIAYFAAKASQAKDQLAQTQQAAQQQQQALTQVQQKLASLDAELARLRDAGRTTVILQAAAPGKKGKANNAAWGAATWGEQANGKSWVRLNAYGLGPAPAGKTYELWFVPASGDPVVAGKLDPNTDGTAFVEGKDLPAVDQGKSVLVAIDDENAKAPGQIVFEVALPKMAPSQRPAGASSDQANAAAADKAPSDATAQKGADAQKAPDAQNAPDAQKGTSLLRRSGSARLIALCLGWAAP
jgi:glucan-binding YG repeat protein